MNHLSVCQGANNYFSAGRCSGHHQFNGRYCRDVAGPDQWCIHCAGFMLLQALLASPPSNEPPHDLDAKRYRRLRILGAAPGESRQLANGTVLRAQSLDRFIDDDLRFHASRGEAAPPDEPEAHPREDAMNPPQRDGHRSPDWVERVAADIRDINPHYHDFEAEVVKLIRAASGEARTAPEPEQG